MVEKIEKISKNLKFIICFFIIAYVLSFIAYVGITYIEQGKTWEKFEYYPELEYQQLEKEANRIIKSGDFESEYLKNCEHNIKLNILTMELEDKDENSISVCVENYQDENQNIIIERDLENQKELRNRNIILMTFYPALGAILLYCLFMVILLIIIVIDEIKTTRADIKKNKQK